MKLRLGSMFAGIGGIDKGFELNNVDLVWANEVDINASKTYERNFKHALFIDDVRNLDASKLEKVDILTAGFPCQSFSIAGHRRGLDDERGKLFFETIRFAKELKPKYILLENVKNLCSHNNGKTFTIMIKKLEEIGYFVKYKILNTATHANIPQNRERLYIIAFKDFSVFNRFNFPEEIMLTKSIDDILEDIVPEKFFYEKYPKIYTYLQKTMNNKKTFYQ